MTSTLTSARFAGNVNKVGFFCANFGTRIWHEPTEPGFAHIKPGTLDDTSQLRPRYQSYKIRKHHWLKLDGIAMSFETMPRSGG